MPEPKFTPKPGQTDYTNIRYSPVINCIVRCRDEIVLQQRSSAMRLYPSYWNGISGFLDTDGSIEDKVHEELHEELGVEPDHIANIRRGPVLVQEAPEYNKTWIVFTVLVTLKEKTELRANWEAAKLEWLPIAAIPTKDLMPGFDEVLQAFSLL